MLELMFVTCMAGDPQSCQDRSLLFAEEMGLMTCMVTGQAHLAAWVETHPKEVVREWKCQVAGAEGTSI